MTGTTGLRLEIYELTKDYDLLEDIQQAIEEDFVTNRYIYDEISLDSVACFVELCSEVTPIKILELVRHLHKASLSVL